MDEKSRIVTEHVYPPIPDRRFDWLAYRDGAEPPDSDGVGGSPFGYGPTEQAAIDDLLTLEDDE